MTSAVIRAARRARAALQRATHRPPPARRPFVRPWAAPEYLPHDPQAGHLPSGPDHAALLALVLGGLVEPADAFLIWLLESDHCRGR